MPNKGYELTPQFERHKEIDAEIIDVFVKEVDKNGWVNIDSEYERKLVAWAPFESGGVLRTTTISGQGQEVKQSWVQQSDGGVNIGPSRWDGRRVIILVLDQENEEA